ncbi:MAG: macro domain-containing protein [Candidatus Methanoperedenaceae archaeon]|nr:macro domain-containing protein [Candidatus Methanoperedenaceae archaeon]
MNKIKIAFTGHRRLGYAQVESMLNKIHAEFPDSVWITGGAIGLDSHAAKYAMLHGIELWLILPFSPAVMTARWNAQQKSFLEASIKYASKFTVLSPVYNVRVYQDRNIRMVDLSDMLAAFWDGSRGGTANCVGYASFIGHRIEMCLREGASASFTQSTPADSNCDACSMIGGETPTSSSSYREVHGDIFTTEAEAIVNTVNCVGAMGRGIALEFKKRYPDLYAAYRQACARKEIKPGHVWVYQAKDRIIFNAAVKDDWRNASRIVWIESCLNELIGLCRSMNVQSIALPWMGAMNGWIPVEQVKATTRRIMSGITDIDITVYEIKRH